jgi:hypothetical protein
MIKERRYSEEVRTNNCTKFARSYLRGSKEELDALEAIREAFNVQPIDPKRAAKSRKAFNEYKQSVEWKEHCDNMRRKGQ